MTNDRLRQVEENLQILREQQGSVEREILLTTGLPRTQAEQRLRSDIKPKLRQFETEYWQILAEQPVEGAIAKTPPDLTPEIIVAELVERSGNCERARTIPMKCWHGCKKSMPK